MAAMTEPDFRLLPNIKLHGVTVEKTEGVCLEI